MLAYDKGLLKNARQFRREMTPHEARLWFEFLTKLTVRVRRQKVIGRYIVDFYIPQKKAVIEIDGLQHTDPKAREADEKRDATLAEIGICVLRYSNYDIQNNLQGVAEDICKRLGVELKR